MKHIKIHIKKNIPGHKAGTIEIVKTDKDGTPLSRFWRDRLQDSKLDGCVEIVKSTKQAKNTEIDKKGSDK